MSYSKFPKLNFYHFLQIGCHYFKLKKLKCILTKFLSFVACSQSKARLFYYFLTKRFSFNSTFLAILACDSSILTKNYAQNYILFSCLCFSFLVHIQILIHWLTSAPSVDHFPMQKRQWTCFICECLSSLLLFKVLQLMLNYFECSQFLT